MTGYFAHIEDESIKNNNFRKVLYTGKFSQLVVMSLLPGEEIGDEVHDHVDQFFRFEVGEGKAILDGEEIAFNADDVVIIPAGVRHNIVNTSANETLKLYTIYSPANHPEFTVHATKAEAMAAEETEHK